MEGVDGSDGGDRLPDAGEAGDYCRHVEAYLCRKNDGHLIRIAGPAFTRVCGWATQGIPLTVVYRGIDRYFERYYARGPRRRPVQIDFCENDVLDAFDEWRRAVGAWTGGRLETEAGRPPADTAPPGEEARPRPRVVAGRRTSLPAHLERLIVRLTTIRAGARLAGEADAVVDATIRELDGARAGASHLRGPARDVLIARLKTLDRDLLDAVRHSLSADTWQEIEREARDELATFKSGMAEEAYRRAIDANAARLLRERFGLPMLEFEG